MYKVLWVFEEGDVVIYESPEECRAVDILNHLTSLGCNYNSLKIEYEEIK